MVQVELPNKNLDQIIKNIEQIFQHKYRHLLSVFDLNGMLLFLIMLITNFFIFQNNSETKQAEDLDECILTALLKAKGSLLMTKLCLEWNRFDTARDLIFEDEKIDKVIRLNTNLLSLIICNNFIISDKYR